MKERNRDNEQMPAIAIRCDAELKKRYQDAVKEIRANVLNDRRQALGEGRSLVYAMARIAGMSPEERTQFMREGRALLARHIESLEAGKPATQEPEGPPETGQPAPDATSAGPVTMGGHTVARPAQRGRNKRHGGPGAGTDREKPGAKTHG